MLYSSQAACLDIYKCTFIAATGSSFCLSKWCHVVLLKASFISWFFFISGFS